jgi:hypothetical protein
VLGVALGHAGHLLDGDKYFWECHVELPHIDVNELEKIIDI